MKAYVAGLAAGMAALAVVAPAQAIPDTKCTLTAAATDVPGVSQLPPGLQELVAPIAEIGEPFNSTDSVLDPSLPFRRLIRAGHHGDDWFVWYEHGGVGYFWQVVVVRVDDGGGVTTVANAGTIADTLCAITDGALEGRVPPYPSGSWAAGGY